MDQDNATFEKAHGTAFSSSAASFRERCRRILQRRNEGCSECPGATLSRRIGPLSSLQAETIEAANADEALDELLHLANNDSTFYDLTDTWTDASRPSSFEVWSANRERLLRSIPSIEERRNDLYPQLVSMLRMILPQLSIEHRRRCVRLLREAEAALK
jgi:hypothetical protein